MANINRVGPGAQAIPARSDGKVRNDRSASSAGATTTMSPAVGDVNTQLRDAQGFDAAKVEQIRTAIEQGQYPLDSKRIAENFTQLESLLAGTAQQRR